MKQSNKLSYCVETQGGQTNRSTCNEYDQKISSTRNPGRAPKLLHLDLIERDVLK